ncbi:hypothetical protein [Hymenobacter convexus]|uniref:hypothetical protein n=1 Tax=Hymenobacter sp. CA1UV-4 TaxID=3063782 RepID=UPI002712BD49|nr:hypothetical protein [Hymenobacter sp. CA1UV-4]MDO7850094.1 hypothetical protein [Hymenobacter sp. CA1UV-4]
MARSHQLTGKSLFLCGETFFMPRYLRITFLLLCGILGLSSCQTVFQGLYGIHGLRPVSSSEMQQLAGRYGIPANQVFVLDTSYRAFLSHLHRRDSAAAKNHYQPLQAAYYDRKGQLQSFYINCYAGGFPNLAWNAAGGLNQFPPKPQAPADTALPLSDYLRYLRQPSGQPLPAQPTADHTIVVQWSRFMGRQSRRLIQAAQRNAALARPGSTVQLLFVNNDNLATYLETRQAQFATKPN